MEDIFELQNPSYNLRSSCNQFMRDNIKTVYYELQSVGYLGLKIWELVPNNIKYSNSFRKFKKLERFRIVTLRKYAWKILLALTPNCLSISFLFTFCW